MTSLSICRQRRPSRTIDSACSSSKRRPSQTVVNACSSKRRHRLATSEVLDASSWSCRKRRSSLSACSSSKRRRRPDNSSPSSWASLCGDLLSLIGWRLLAGDGDMLDYVRFRAVCAHWRSGTVYPRGRSIVDSRFHPRRWMMLSEGHGLRPGHRKLRDYIRFLNLSIGPVATLVRSNLYPLFRDHIILTAIDGLLLLQRQEDTAVRLLHPFTGDIVEFPPLTTLVDPADQALLKKHRRAGVRDASLSMSADGAITLMIVLYWQPRVAFGTPGDKKWSIPSWNLSSIRFKKTISFQGKLYVLGFSASLPLGDGSETSIFRVDPLPRDDHHDMPPPELIAKFPSDNMMCPLQLAECNSEIMLIDFGDPPANSRVAVYRLADLILGKVVPLTSIGDDNVILTGETTLSVSSRLLPNIDGNSVVAVNYRERYLGQYHFGSAAWSRVADGCTFGCVTGPCCLIHHVFTCCNRSTWKRGAISFLFADWRTDLKEQNRQWRLGI